MMRGARGAADGPFDVSVLTGTHLLHSIAAALEAAGIPFIAPTLKPLEGRVESVLKPQIEDVAAPLKVQAGAV